MNYFSEISFHHLLVGLMLCVVAFASGCVTSPFAPQSAEDEFAKRRDGAPLLPLDPAQIEDAVPKNEAIRLAGNKSPYQVFGKTYHVMPVAERFSYAQEGVASWYGTKFHGRNTSNGELYSLYGMTAAHKSLPIPCYVKVTNLDNGLSTVVRVNDRGPFHSNRIIDLSYAAATKLGYASRGTARVRVEVIDTRTVLAEQQTVKPSAPSPSPVANSVQAPASQAVATGSYLQVGAFKSYQSALELQQSLQRLLAKPVAINPGSGAIYRVHIGPVNYAEIEHVKGVVQQASLGTPHLVKRECEIFANC
jgi:rare lipoprotein A